MPNPQATDDLLYRMYIYSWMCTRYETTKELNASRVPRPRTHAVLYLGVYVYMYVHTCSRCSTAVIKRLLLLCICLDIHMMTSDMTQYHL
jgi:hypothetical protein